MPDIRAQNRKDLTNLIGWKVVSVRDECDKVGLVFEHASAFGDEESRMRRVVWCSDETESDWL